MATKAELTYPANDIYAVTQHDTTNDPNGPFRGLILTVAGTVRLSMRGGSTVNFLSGSLAVGMIHPIRFTRIHTTGTTATGMYGVKEEI